ncbi:uncharacterized protein LOC110988902 isoform X2 [Acanthaster planci]|uniref:Uncharacterized protein LOC110988902 isoform X2 n=1 Tax=Acanthaster planci TaxID=133434 RepID=A0A8B7ZTZ1_ACAPL|nr:uncharacterized protein LOC110988902 isoform X2 [Acanthaster planci]
MENLKLYVLFSTDGAPQEIPFAASDEADHFHIESREQHGFEGTVPLPLPKFLLIFALGEWPQDNHFRHMSAEIHFGKDLDPFHVGTLSKDNRSVCWQGTWREDLQVRGMLMSEEGLTGLLVITPGKPDREG